MVRRPVPSFRISLPVKRLEMIVPTVMITETKPAPSSGSPNSDRMRGQAAPNIESGSPRLMNAR